MKSLELRSLSALCLTLCAGEIAAQKATVAYSPTYSLSRGDSDAGATLYANAYIYGKKEHVSYPAFKAYLGEGRANATARLDAKFLGSSRSVAYFNSQIQARGNLVFPTAGGLHTSCSQQGSAFLRIAGTTLWNKNFEYDLAANRALTMRIVSPTLTVFAGAPVVISGRLNGSIGTSVNLRLFGCHFSAKFNGTASASASGSGSGTVYGPIYGGADVSFQVTPQVLRANVTAQPPVGNSWTSPSAWLKGRVTYTRGWMRASIKAWAYVPWKVTSTVASWFLGGRTITLFNR